MKDFIGEERALELEDLSSFLNEYAEFRKAQMLGITFTLKDITKTQLEAFFVIDQERSKVQTRKLDNGRTSTN